MSWTLVVVSVEGCLTRRYLHGTVILGAHVLAERLYVGSSDLIMEIC